MNKVISSTKTNVALLGLTLLLMIRAGAEVRTAALQQPAASTSSKAKHEGAASSQYHFDVWTTDNGLPQNSVNSMVQTRDGFLWLTTFDGLVRYDGVHFTIFNAGNTNGLKSSRFSQLFEDRAGNLWIMTEDFGLVRYRDGMFTTITREDGLPNGRVLHIRDEADGTVLMETPDGLVWWKDGKFVPEDPFPGRPYPGFGFPVRSGAVWYLDKAGLHKVENGRVTADAPVTGLTSHDIKSLYESRNGELWMGVTDGVLMRFRDGKFNYYSRKDGLSGDRINCLFEDRQGNIWLGVSFSGLFRFKDGQFTRYTKADGLIGNDVLSIYEDREGILWIGATAGLNRLRDNIITSYSAEDGLMANNTYPICQDRAGTIWIGTWPGLSKYRDGVFTGTGQEYVSSLELVTALMIDREGGLWVGSLGGGAKRFKKGKDKSYLVADGLPSNVVRAIFEDRQGAVWFGTLEGLGRAWNGELSTYTTKDGLPANGVNIIFEDSRGNIWIGTQAGLCRYSDGTFNSYSQEESLSHYLVRAIHEDSEGVIWIGTYDHGLTRLKDGKFTNFTIKEGLFNNGVFQILEDARGNFWISCNLGIYRVSKRELTDYAEGKIKSISSVPYGKRDGMLNSECNGGVQPAGIKSLDGKLWFPTQGGVAVLDPEAVQVSEQPPPLMIEEVLLDNKPVPLRATVEIPPEIENFEIHYTGLSFIMSDRIRFKYKLEGLDKDWVDADTRRVAYYSHVSPGNYTFRVIAANRDGIWNMEGATTTIRIVPPFWKTWWFLAIALAVAAGLALLGFKLRIARLEKARKAQQAFSQQLISSQESERQRIAAELHDGLGQHLLIIKNSALLGLGTLQQQDRGREQLGDISDTASQAIDEVREISYNLRPYQLDDLGLTKAIEFIIAKVAASSEIKFSSALEPIDGLFSPGAEINIYRIVQESLNNIVKHSRASQASIVIDRNSHSVDVTIQDNGRGFNTEETAGAEGVGGFGLKGISERARMLGAKYVIHSAAGEGTAINLTLETQNGRFEE